MPDSPFQQAVLLRQQLVKDWNRGHNPNLDKCEESLNKLKVVLTSLKFLPGTSKESTKDELLLAREVLEIGAFCSIARKDIPSFERYMAQLKCYYLDYKSFLADSVFKNELLGLNLLCLLSQNRVAEFHTELELFSYPDVQILDNVYIHKAVSLEQNIMEGRYRQVFIAKNTAPSERYNYFIDILVNTIRDEIACCVEKSYNRLNEKASMAILNLKPAELKTYAANRGWTEKGGFYTFGIEKKHDDLIPARDLAKDEMEYAKELEMIV